VPACDAALVARRRVKSAPPPPTQIGVHAGLGYALFRPDGPALGGVLILHGADSCKESHFDFARALRAGGLAAVSLDLPGHGASEARFAADVVERLAALAALLPPGPLGLRGSSLGGYLALLAAEPLGADAVVGICPASADGLAHGLRLGRFAFDVDAPGLEAFLAEPAHEAIACVRRLHVPMLLLHAQGDEVVPVEHSRALLAASPSSVKQLVAPRGGHHRSIAHDPELISHSSRFLARALAGAAADSADGEHSARIST
jgi:alpha-beta hydrolase superfamily lysophospholipase